MLYNEVLNLSEYDSVFPFSEGFARVWRFRQERGEGFIDTNGNEVFGGLKYSAVSSFENGYAHFEKGKISGKMDKNGKSINSFAYVYRNVVLVTSVAIIGIIILVKKINRKKLNSKAE